MILREKWKKLGLMLLTGGLSTKDLPNRDRVPHSRSPTSAQAILTKRRPDDKYNKHSWIDTTKEALFFNKRKAGAVCDCGATLFKEERL